MKAKPRRLVILLPDPWMALCAAQALPGTSVCAFGGAVEAARFAAAGVEATLAPADGELHSPALLADPAVGAHIAAEPSLLIAFKPSVRIEEAAASLGAELALAPATLARGLENKLALRELAHGAGIPLPTQAMLRLALDLPYEDVAARFSARFVVQSPRGFMGKRTFVVDDERAWIEVCATLPNRPAKITRFVPGRSGTVGAVVDKRGAVLVTAPIVQITGEPRLTPYPWGSCGNDFRWRPSPSPGDSAAMLAERMGPVLAAKGYRGHFGLDFVVGEDGGAVLIEINPRLTASFTLYSAWEPALMSAHLRAIRGETISAGQLPPLDGGQLIVHNCGADPIPALRTLPGTGVALLPAELDATGPPTFWPGPAPSVQSGGTLGRVVGRGVIVDASGDLRFPRP